MELGNLAQWVGEIFRAHAHVLLVRRRDTVVVEERSSCVAILGEMRRLAGGQASAACMEAPVRSGVDKPVAPVGTGVVPVAPDVAVGPVQDAPVEWARSRARL